MTLNIFITKNLKPEKIYEKKQEPTLSKKVIVLNFNFIKRCLKDMSSQLTRKIWN